MALGTLGTALATSAVKAGVGIGAQKLFGSDSGGTSDFRPAKLSAGGFTGRGGNIQPTQERIGLVGNVAETFPQQADAVRGLREGVAPGMSDLRQSRLARLESARSRSVGNLRDNLARRRVLGSSFAQDALARAEGEFAQQADEIEAESFLQELDLTNQLTQQEFDLRRGEFQTMLDEMNLQAEVAGKLAQGVTAQLGANARLRSEMAAKSAQGAGQFFGRTLSPAIDSAFGGGFDASNFLPGTTTTGSGFNITGPLGG